MADTVPALLLSLFTEDDSRRPQGWCHSSGSGVPSCRRWRPAAGPRSMTQPVQPDSRAENLIGLLSLSQDGLSRWWMGIQGSRSMASVADRIMHRVWEQPNPRWVCTPKDFLDLGSRQAVDKALSRLVRFGRLRRVGRGFYDKPVFSELLGRPAPMDLEAAVEALARRDGIRVMPNGLVAANGLGLTNAVPVEVSYVTDGYSRTLKFGRRTVRFQHAPPRVMWWAGRPAQLVVQALLWLGPYASRDPKVCSMLIHRLSAEVKQDLMANRHYLPGWTHPFVQRIASGS